MINKEHINRLVQELIDAGHPIRIVSGEGEIGAAKPYTGKRTIRAIKMRIARERRRRGKDGWVRASVYSHESALGGDVWMDVETGYYL
jgi:hypothetical protein